MFKGTSGGNIYLGLVPVVRVRDNGNDTGLDQDWDLQMKVCGQMWVGKWDGGQSKTSVVTMLNLKWLLNI